MRRDQLEHILRAAAGITDVDRFVIIGSQAVLGQFPGAPTELLSSMEADIFSFHAEDAAELIEGSIGEGSPFHTTFGYFAHGVGEETAVLPAAWKDRLVPVCNENTGGATGLCLEVHDLAVSKLVAGREKDFEFVAALLRHGLVSAETVRDRLARTPIDGVRCELCLKGLERTST